MVDAVRVNLDQISLEFHPSNNYTYVVNRLARTVSVIESSDVVSYSPKADAGPDQSVNSNDIVQLDGSNSSDPNNFQLAYF